jgi:hypothetical protein
MEKIDIPNENPVGVPRKLVMRIYEENQHAEADLSVGDLHDE